MIKTKEEALLKAKEITKEIDRPIKSGDTFLKHLRNMEEYIKDLVKFLEEN